MGVITRDRVCGGDDDEVLRRWVNFDDVVLVELKCRLLEVVAG